MSSRLDGRVAAVTGASSGIGGATALALADAGARASLGGIVYAVSQPDRVNVNEVLIRPTGQRG